MQESSAKWLALGAVALAAAVLVLALRGGTGNSGGDDAVLTRLEAMQAQAEARDAAMRRDLERLQSQLDAGTRRAAATPEPPPPSPDVQKAQAQQQNDAQRKRLEVVFAGQGAAPRNDPAPAALEAAFAYPGVLDAAELPLDEDVQCRARMCLVRARFGPYADGSDWATRVLMEVAATLPDARLVSVPLPGGSTELRIYAARAGVRDPFATVP